MRKTRACHQLLITYIRNYFLSRSSQKSRGHIKIWPLNFQSVCELLEVKNSNLGYYQLMTRPILIAFFYSISILPNSLFGANSATAIVTFGIDSILEMSVSGNPGVLNIYDAQAGSQPEPAVDRTTSYAITTNNTAQKITVVMDTSLPIGVNLSVELTPPAGAISFGQINLSTTPQMAVVNISSIAESGLPITYIFSAAVTTAPFGPIFRTVTYTIGP